MRTLSSVNMSTAKKKIIYTPTEFVNITTQSTESFINWILHIQYHLITNNLYFWKPITSLYLTNFNKSMFLENNIENTVLKMFGFKMSKSGDPS